MENEQVPGRGNQEQFQLEWHGDTLIVAPAKNTESMRWDLIEQAAEVILSPLKGRDLPTLILDLSEVSYVGSVFLSLMLRCHKLVRSRGGEMVICGANRGARELLRITSLDTLWAIYDTRQEALAAVSE